MLLQQSAVWLAWCPERLDDVTSRP